MHATGKWIRFGHRQITLARRTSPVWSSSSSFSCHLLLRKLAYLLSARLRVLYQYVYVVMHVGLLVSHVHSSTSSVSPCPMKLYFTAHNGSIMNKWKQKTSTRANTIIQFQSRLFSCFLSFFHNSSKAFEPPDPLRACSTCASFYVTVFLVRWHTLYCLV